MRTLGQVVVAAAVVLAVLAGGCGDKCTGESPQVSQIANCSAPAGQQVSYEIRLCPTCNQNLTACDVDTHAANASGGQIFLNPVVEACEGGGSCGPSCQPNPTRCTFTVPAGAAVGVTYDVQVLDAGTGQVRTGTLTVSSDPASCTLPPPA